VKGKRFPRQNTMPTAHTRIQNVEPMRNLCQGNAGRRVITGHKVALVLEFASSEQGNAVAVFNSWRMQPDCNRRWAAINFISHGIPFRYLLGSVRPVASQGGGRRRQLANGGWWRAPRGRRPAGGERACCVAGRGGTWLPGGAAELERRVGGMGGAGGGAVWGGGGRGGRGGWRRAGGGGGGGAGAGLPKE